MKKTKDIVARRQAELDEHLDPSWQPETKRPILGGEAIAYRVSDRVTGISCGGLGVVVQLAEHIGVPDAIDRHLHLLKRHLPYHESDHVLSLAYNIVVGGRCLESLEQRRQDVGYLRALGARRIPDPTTAGDFLRRFSADSVRDLMKASTEISRKIWRRQPKSNRKLAVIDVDGTIVETLGEHKQGADFSYKGKWGYGPLVVSLANSQEVLYTVNRSARRPSHDGSVPWLDRAVDWARSSGFKRVRLRGDSDFSLTANFDRWSDDDVEFIFGIDAQKAFVERAKALEDSAWRPLVRRSRRSTKKKRRRSPNFKEEKIKEHKYLNYRLQGEEVAEICYTPLKAKREYRMVVLRKRIRAARGDQMLLDEDRYFFYVTNVPRWRMSAARVILESNARCNQENLIEQLKNGVRATQMPVGEFVANWAYMVIGALAWNLKTWLGLVLPESLGARDFLRMEYRRFTDEVISLATQILRTGRRLEYRLLELGRWGELLLEASEWFRRHRPRRVYS